MIKAETNIPKAKRVSTLRKLLPTAMLPNGAVMRAFAAEEIQSLRRRLAEPLECVFDPSFSRSNAERLYGPTGGPGLPPGVTPPVAPPPARSLSMAEERDLFLRFNYARHRLMSVLVEYRGKRLSGTAARETLYWDGVAREICAKIVNANLGLVPTMVERSRITGVDFGELISEGQLALLRAIDKFDIGRGFKFSTYACRAILTSLARAVALMARHRSRYPMEFDPDMQRGDLLENRRPYEDEDFVRRIQAVLKENRAELTRAERRVISERFGFSGRLATPKPGTQKTLRQVAAIFGVTKARVRQIQNKALGKRRLALDENTSPHPQAAPATQ
jgi:RNA polymerase sigma factor (sigma-70 family)